MFHISKEESEKLSIWMKEQDEKVYAAQKERNKERNKDRNQAYYGAIGGAYTYMFTPNSIGCVFKVKNGVTQDIIDLTDYGMW